AWDGLDVCVDDLVEATAVSTEIRHGAATPARVPLGGRPVRLVHRRAFDRRLIEAAMQAGVDVHEREAALAIGEGSGITVTASGGVYRGAAILIGTGAEGSLGEPLGLRTPSRVRAVGLEIDAPARADGLDPCSLIFDYNLPGGYAWAFPKGDRWNVGVLSVRRAVAPQLRARLAQFITELGIRFELPGDPTRFARGRRIPFHEPGARLSRGRAALIGDAAGLPDPLFAEGIAQAIWSGQAAADSTLSLLGAGSDALAGYETSLDALMGKHMRRMRWLARAVYARPALAVAALRMPPHRWVARRVSTEGFAGDPALRPSGSTSADRRSHLRRPARAALQDRTP
ncbi:MAG: NAD(P)/FAD-dependent oxidoreductase, partial [Candidatus Eremiobacteraeota bacterium]|nr:NAD(P)/FAD-dependent oxidoreductase [Candidatus Eremiobacteraeota bacterium]